MKHRKFAGACRLDSPRSSCSSRTILGASLENLSGKPAKNPFSSENGLFFSSIFSQCPLQRGRGIVQGVLLVLGLFGLALSFAHQTVQASDDSVQVVLQDWTAQPTESGWTLQSDAWQIGYAFSKQNGIDMTRFERMGDTPFAYITAPVGIMPLEQADSSPVAAEWNLVDDQAHVINYGGKPALEVTMTVESMVFRVTLHAVAFPGCAVVRQWFTLQNLGAEPQASLKYCPLKLTLQNLNPEDAFRVDYIRGGNPTPDQGERVSQVLESQNPERQKVEFLGNMTQEFIPLVVVQRESAPEDALMAEVDYNATWNMVVQRQDHEISLRCDIDPSTTQTLGKNAQVETPVLTLAVFQGNLDRLMETLYDWQYTYLWDYTNPDYYAKTRSCSNWVFCSRILQEQYIYRLAGMDLIDVSANQRAGYDIIWNDAGWSSFPGYPPDNYGSVFSNTYEGPDYRISGRYFERCGLKRLLWFAGQPSLGLLRSKEGAWGDFEWRTDGMGLGSLEEEQRFKKRVRDYLEENPDRSFHTCSGGSRYAHTFDIARYGNYHYFSDLGRGNNLNYSFSYFETPDRWGDTLSFINKDYDKNGTRSKLAMVPLPCNIFNDPAIEAIRVDLQIYRYLLNEKVAGRGSYMYHPEVKGDPDNHYLQRVSPDHKRAIIIPFVQPKEATTVYPCGLLEGELYQVNFQEQPETWTKTGRELMEYGIELAKAPQGELIYLNLPDYPGCPSQSEKPLQGPDSAVSRRENNIGTEGVAIYWTGGNDIALTGYYEIARDGQIVGDTASGRYWFDYTSGWNPDVQYSVRAVGRNGQKSEWTLAKAIQNEQSQSSSMGNHAEKMAENGWFAETSADLKTFDPMHWVPCPKMPYGDFGGTPNQPGSIDGYWEGGLCARVGRGWQQASPDVFCVRGYTIPEDGDYLITGRAMKEWYHREVGSDLNASVLHNDQCLASQLLVKNDRNGLSHELVVSAKKGDKIRFVVDKNSPEAATLAHFDEQADIIGWIPVVTNLTASAVTESRSEAFAGLFLNVGGKTLVDQTGQTWAEDQFGTSGEMVQFITSSEVVDLNGLSDPDLWLTARKGKLIEYEIPLPSGLYSIKLGFVEPEYRWRDLRLMNVVVNGATIDQDLDLVMRQSEESPIVYRTYRYQQPGSDGKLHLAINATQAEAVLSSLEIQSENRDHVMIDCGSDVDFIDWAGSIWQKDSFFQGGESVTLDGAKLHQATPTLYDVALYTTGRQGQEFEYTVPLAQASYSVHLKFAELLLAEQGKRPIEISINGEVYNTDWDAAAYTQNVDYSCDIRFNNISPVNGVIKVKIRATGDEPAILQGLEFD